MESKYSSAKTTMKDDLRLINELDTKVKFLNATASDAANALQALESDHQNLIRQHMHLEDEYQNCRGKLGALGGKVDAVEREKQKVEEENGGKGCEVTSAGSRRV